MMFCTNCGTPRDGDTRFCTQCGQRFADDVPVDESAESAAPEPAAPETASTPVPTPHPNPPASPDFRQPPAFVPSPQTPPAAQPLPSAQPLPAQPSYAPRPVPQPQSAQQPAFPQPAPAVLASAAPAAAAPVARRRMKRSTIAVLCTLLVLVAGLTIAFFTLRATLFSPREPLSAYVNAISSGDFAKASELVDPGIDNAKRVLLVNDAAKDENNRIKNVEIGELTQDKATGDYGATVTYTVNGAKQSMPVTLERSGRQWLVFDAWKVSTPMLQQVSVAVPAAMHHVDVNGVSVDLGALGPGSSVDTVPKNSVNYDPNADYYDMTSYTLVAYPGAYAFTTSPSDYVTTETITVTEPGDTAYLLPEATSKLSSALLDKINEKLKPCLAAKTAAAPDGCSYAIDLSNSVATINNETVSRSLDTKPSISDIDFNDGTFTTNSFKISAKYQYHWSTDAEWTDGSAWTYARMTGTFSIDGEKLTVTFDEED
ncbi:hypothetical protein [Bifidobacterium avesanii]|uniref:Zinc-ribbon domain-containing protein n=1 Tax=Bifidobacterium avesanii TaxID=1798157 RepID=A0A7K3THG4_9BIFI|nr:hypothetical protein [Bifidobacterium avesanii]KAB8292637.1 hypothetical protein DSM100685_0926 [Bifidobacterium avesanii]NEG78535.1 hypothetical protein [Bifidobacterium avesanii]